MKKPALLLLFSIFLASYSAFAQQEETPTRKGQIGITFSSFGSNDVVRSEEPVGGPSYHGDHFYTLGINYLYPLNQTFDFETGVEYSNHQITINPMYFYDQGSVPDPGHKANVALISIPVSVRVNFLKYFFINGGIFFDMDASQPMPIDSQTGLGANLGLGFKYKFKCGVTTFVNPYTKAHSIFAFSRGTYPQHLLESGFRFGLMVNLN